jgi:DNA polymerase-4
MNSFFASCEQQVNYYLRNKPIAVCVYPGKYGSIIAPSIEAKRKGVKTGMRLSDAIKICPELIPLETHPSRYREIHVELMDVFHKYSDVVYAKSIDEAVIKFTHLKYIHKDLIKVAQQIKEDIKSQVGDYLKCSIGIAPNTFLAKLASDIKKPDGLTLISPENIDDVLKNIKLTDLPGIAKPTALKLNDAGITSVVQLRHTNHEKLKKAFKSIVGIQWNQRLNFIETENYSSQYKSMQAMRQISKAQRKSLQNIKNLLASLCLTLEKRLTKQGLYLKEVTLTVRYETGEHYHDIIKSSQPIQEGAEIMKLINKNIKLYEDQNPNTTVINSQVNMLSVNVFDFVSDEENQFNMFDNNLQKRKLRKTVEKLRDKYGNTKVKKAAELHEKEAMVDAIGFGSVKHLYKYQANDSDILITENFPD